MLEDASIKLSSVASSLTTVSAGAMLGALVAGERDPQVLAQLARGRMRVKIPALTEALTGCFDEDHTRLAHSMLHSLEPVQVALDALDAVIAEACRPRAHQLELLQPSPGRREGRPGDHRGDRRRHVPVPSAAHLAAWAGLAPAIYGSAGKRRPSGRWHGDKWLAAMLVEAAGSVERMKGANYLHPAGPAHRLAGDGLRRRGGRAFDARLGLLHPAAR